MSGVKEKGGKATAGNESRTKETVARRQERNITRI